ASRERVPMNLLDRAFLPMLIVLSSCANRASAPADAATAAAKPGTGGERKYLLDRVDDTAIVQLWADGYDGLKKDDKILCWHLYQAAVAGRDIYLDQRFAKNLAIRDLLEELWLHKNALEAQDRAEVERYTKLFWVHSGIHHNLTTHKMLLSLDDKR